MQQAELQEKARLGTLTAQEQSMLDQNERNYAGDMDRLVRGEDARLDTLTAQGAMEQDRLMRGEAARMDDNMRGEAARMDDNMRGEAAQMERESRQYAGDLDFKTAQANERNEERSNNWQQQNQNQYLGMEGILDQASRDKDWQIQTMERQGDIYSRGLEMDRIQTLLAGSLGQASSANSAAASASAAASTASAGNMQAMMGMAGQMSGGKGGAKAKGSAIALTAGELLKTII